jgi:SAM-dependent methyltransferase
MSLKSGPAPQAERTAPLPPLPPAELRRLVGHDESLFDLRDDGSPVFPYLPDPEFYRSVFDFGCGCGRIARQLLVQKTRPERYVGIDIHRKMIAWCQENLTAFDPAFEFYHHDVWNMGLAPDNTRQSTAPFPVQSGAFSLVVAHSVFTHIYKEQTEFYLGEVARILAEDGIARTTWFLFDRLTFPMMFDFQVELFINEIDPTNAVIYDWRWLLNVFERRGLRVVHTVPPFVRGHQWEIYLRKRMDGRGHEFPADVSSHQMLCGSGFSIANEPATAQKPDNTTQKVPAIASPAGEGASAGKTFANSSPPPTERHLLRFTGKVEPEEFHARCRELPWWYHSFYFDNGLNVRGDYDIGADVSAYGFPESMEGMRVLDIGTGAGWFAFYFEQLGAEVVTVDTRGYCDSDVFGRSLYPSIDKENRSPDRFDEDGTPIYYSPASRGFGIMKEMLGSRVRFRNARVHDLKPEMFGGTKFDLVFLGAILSHLRDPIGALMAARSVCRHRVIALTPVVLGEKAPDVPPRQYLPYTAVDKTSWWLPNEACFRQWFLAAGLTGVDVDRQVILRSDVQRFDKERIANGDQILRLGSAFVP